MLILLSIVSTPDTNTTHIVNHWIWSNPWIISFSAGLALLLAAAAGRFIVWAIGRKLQDQIEPFHRDLREHMAQEEKNAADNALALQSIGNQFQINEIEHVSFNHRITELEDSKKA